MSSIAVIGSTTAIGEGKYISVPDSLTALKITFDNGVLIDGTIEGGGLPKYNPSLAQGIGFDLEVPFLSVIDGIEICVNLFRKSVELHWHQSSWQNPGSLSIFARNHQGSIYLP